MPNQFYKGRTNNHLTWVMVDATDFATPESALSAAMTIKIHGKLRGATGTNFVSSGTGSLTNDITHVGASATGIYTIALAKADLSDASAAWYDQYIITLAGTGAAQQVLVVDGGIDFSTILAFSDAISDTTSKLVVMSGILSDTLSAVAVGNSRVLLVQSSASQVESVLSSLNSEFLSRVPKLVASDSALSDLASDLKSYLVVMSSMDSNIYSAVSDMHSDLKSLLGGTFPTSSDIASVVWTNTPGAAAASRILRIISDTSQIDSLLSSLNSEFLSRVPKRVATDSQLSDVHSDIRSAYQAAGGVTASDIASVVWTNTPGTAAASRILQIRNQVSDQQSDFQSRVPKAVATNSQLSDLHSDLRSFMVVQSAVDSNIYSLLSDMGSILSNVNSIAAASPDTSDIASAVLVELSNMFSDVKSAVLATNPTASDIASVVWTNTPGAAAASRILLILSHASQIDSVVSGLNSEFLSRVPKIVANNSQLSDLASDIKSAVAAGGGGATSSDIASVVWTNAAGAAAASRILQIRNQVSDLQSDFQSRVPKAVATNSQLSDLHSDLRSHLVVTSGVVSDIYSLLSDVASDVTVISGVVSDVYSRITAGVELSSDAVSNVVSAVTAGAIADPLHVNVREVNSTSLVGDGNVTPWGPE